MHYKDGTLAQIGDLVKGTTYNTGGVLIVGTLVGITPSAPACNARVALAFVKDAGANSLPFPKYVYPEGRGYTVPTHPYVSGVMTGDGYCVAHRENIYQEDGTTVAEQTLFIGTKIDSTACSDLELIHRPE